MSLKLFELVGTDPSRPFSPFCWRTRMALAHKGLDHASIPWRFTEKDAIAPHGSERVPVLLHKDVSEDDDRLTTLRRYITNLCEDGECNPDTLQKAGLLYLRKLDELGEERDERLARYGALQRSW